MKIHPDFGRFSMLDLPKKLEQQHKETQLVKQPVFEDEYDIDVKIHDNNASAIQHTPSWPSDCDTPPCNATGTYGDSCHGTCHRDCG